LDGEGEIVEWIGAASDVTARRRALDDLARVTAEAEQQRHFYDALISSTPDLVYAFDRNYRFLFANRALLAMWDRTLEDSVGKSLVEIGYEPWHAEMHEREIDQVIATKQPIRGEVGFPHATLGWRIYDYIFTPVLDSAGEVDWIAGTTRDITDRKRTEEHLQLLIHELNHRVKNTLATIQSIAAQTFRGESDQAARAAFDSRLIALSEAHTILTRTNWEGAELKDIAERALAAFQSEGHYPERVRIDGCEVQLRPQVALALAMAFHELASNAAKYGALSTVSGSIRLHWEREDDRLRITWKEAGGPPVATPSHRGFGTRLIEQGLARELKGEVRLDYQPDGVVCTIDIPLPSERRQDESS
jgi:PAS domain S-box-containing protein